MTNHAHGRDIIEQILENMRSQTEVLRYSTIVASAYNVHLHSDDHARLEGLIPEIIAQSRRALDEELARLNRAHPLEEKLRRFVRQPRLPFQRAGSEWAVTVLPDPNEELDPGDILVDATLVTPGSDDLGGSRTQRIVTHRHGDRVERRYPPETAAAAAAAEQAAGGAQPAHGAAVTHTSSVPASSTNTISSPGAPAPVHAGPSAMGSAPATAPSTDTATTPQPDTAATPALATLRWRDDRGERTYRMMSPAIKVGRGGATYWVDVKLETAFDVSREHFRLRWDADARRFMIQDLSSFGTTVDGAPLPQRPADGDAPEVPLPPGATIVLAGALTMRFEAEART